MLWKLTHQVTKLWKIHGLWHLKDTFLVTLLIICTFLLWLYWSRKRRFWFISCLAGSPVVSCVRLSAAEKSSKVETLLGCMKNQPLFTRAPSNIVWPWKDDAGALIHWLTPSDTIRAENLSQTMDELRKGNKRRKQLSRNYEVVKTSIIFSKNPFLIF